MAGQAAMRAVGMISNVTRERGSRMRGLSAIASLTPQRDSAVAVRFGAAPGMLAGLAPSFFLLPGKLYQRTRLYYNANNSHLS
ncbi:hypothetical protein UB46_39865 [Burkholderiaceae bacterium 16]|nr:hypothetical protein UB46_39865 [Burkholderiaceae bacterium 16]